MGFWGDESCHKNANVVGCALTCELIVLFCSTIYYIDNETDLKDLWFCFWNNVLNFVKTCTVSFQIDIHDYDGKLFYGFYGLRKVIEIY